MTGTSSDTAVTDERRSPYMPPRRGRATPKRPRSRAATLVRRLLLAAAAAALALILWCGFLYWRIMTYEGAEPSAGPVPPADVGIVLGASLWNDRPSPGLRERLDLALELYRAGAFPAIIVSGGLDHNGSTLTEAEGMRNYLTEQGVPADAIVLEPKATSTLENLELSQELMAARGWSSAVIVTHRYHGARAEDVARTLGYDRAIVSVTDTRTMNIGYHRAREVLAYSKWMLDKLRLLLT